MMRMRRDAGGGEEGLGGCKSAEVMTRRNNYTTLVPLDLHSQSIASSPFCLGSQSSRPCPSSSVPMQSSPLWRIFRIGALAALAAGTLCVMFSSRGSSNPHPLSLAGLAAPVKDLTQAHDTQIPFFLPPFLAFFASMIYGLTSFGEAITFMIGWSLCGAMGLLGPDFSFAKGVVYSSMINLVAFPVTIWIAREEIRRTICWGLYCSLMLCIFENDGVKVLLRDHTGYARHFIAIALACFAFWRANSAAHDFGRARTVAASPEPLWNATDANGGAAHTLDEHETLVLDSRERWCAHWHSVEKLLTEFPALRRVYEAAFPRCYESNKTTETALLIMAAGFMLSGFMFGLASTGGPPMMVTFIALKSSKGSIRAIRNVAGLTSILFWFASAARHDKGLHMWSTEQEWPMLLALVVSGAIGSSIGAWLRNFVSRDHLLFCFYFLIWGDAALLLDIFDPSSALIVSRSEMLIATVLLLASVTVCYFHPDAVDSLLQKSDEMIAMLSPRDKPVAVSLSPRQREQLIAHIEALKASGRLSKEQEDALNEAVEQRDPRAAAALRQDGREEAHGEVQEALVSLARRVASERK